MIVAAKIEKKLLKTHLLGLSKCNLFLDTFLACFSSPHFKKMSDLPREHLKSGYMTKRVFQMAHIFLGSSCEELEEKILRIDF